MYEQEDTEAVQTGVVTGVKSQEATCEISCSGTDLPSVAGIMF